MNIRIIAILATIIQFSCSPNNGQEHLKSHDLEKGNEKISFTYENDFSKYGIKIKSPEPLIDISKIVGSDAALHYALEQNPDNEKLYTIYEIKILDFTKYPNSLLINKFQELEDTFKKYNPEQVTISGLEGNKYEMEHLNRENLIFLSLYNKKVYYFNVVSNSDVSVKFTEFMNSIELTK
jgi:hypothetical protein